MPLPLVPIAASFARTVIKQKARKAAVKQTRKGIKKGLDRPEQKKKENEDNFKKLLNRAKTANKRLTKYNLPEAALPTLEEYRQAESKDRTKMTKAVKSFVENTPSDYNLKLSEKHRQEGKISGTPNSHKTAVEESEKMARRDYKRRTNSETENLSGSYNEALRRFSTMLSKYNIWQGYVIQLLDVFRKVKTQYGITFANIFGQLILDNWDSITATPWEYPSEGEGASIGFIKSMNYLNYYAEQAQKLYNQSTDKDNQDYTRYTFQYSE